MFETQKPILNCLSTTQLYSVKRVYYNNYSSPPQKKTRLYTHFQILPNFHTGAQ